MAVQGSPTWSSPRRMGVNEAHDADYRAHSLLELLSPDNVYEGKLRFVTKEVAENDAPGLVGKIIKLKALAECLDGSGNPVTLANWGRFLSHWEAVGGGLVAIADKSITSNMLADVIQIGANALTRLNGLWDVSWADVTAFIIDLKQQATTFYDNLYVRGINLIPFGPHLYLTKADMLASMTQRKYQQRVRVTRDATEANNGIWVVGSDDWTLTKETATDAEVVAAFPLYDNATLYKSPATVQYDIGSGNFQLFQSLSPATGSGVAGQAPWVGGAINATYWKAISAPTASGATTYWGTLKKSATDATTISTAIGERLRIRGAWQPNTVYPAWDAVTNGGIIYYTDVPISSGATFVAANWKVFAVLPDEAALTISNGKLTLKTGGVKYTHLDPTMLATSELTQAQKDILSNAANWTGTVFTGSLSNARKGLDYADNTYYYRLVDTNLPIRLQRV